MLPLIHRLSITTSVLLNWKINVRQMASPHLIRFTIKCTRTSLTVLYQPCTFSVFQGWEWQHREITSLKSEERLTTVVSEFKSLSVRRWSLSLRKTAVNTTLAFVDQRLKRRRGRNETLLFSAWLSQQHGNDLNYWSIKTQGRIWNKIKVLLFAGYSSSIAPQYRVIVLQSISAQTGGQLTWKSVKAGDLQPLSSRGGNDLH